MLSAHLIFMPLNFKQDHLAQLSVFFQQHSAVRWLGLTWGWHFARLSATDWGGQQKRYGIYKGNKCDGWVRGKKAMKM